jgi:hypothetical protein
VPKQEDSGESPPKLGISKAGDTGLRKRLVGSAHYILGPFGPDTDFNGHADPIRMMNVVFVITASVLLLGILIVAFGSASSAKWRTLTSG